MKLIKKLFTIALSSIALVCVLPTFASAFKNLNVNNSVYSYPETDDEEWGADATNWAVAVTSGMLQKKGGTFTLTNEAYFGENYGLRVPYIKLTTSTVASTGAIRMGNKDVINWRNATNSANLSLSVSSPSNELVFNGTLISGSTAIYEAILSTYNVLNSSITNAYARIDALDASTTTLPSVVYNATATYLGANVYRGNPIKFTQPVIFRSSVTIETENIKAFTASAIQVASNQGDFDAVDWVGKTMVVTIAVLDEEGRESTNYTVSNLDPGAIYPGFEHFKVNTNGSGGQHPTGYSYRIYLSTLSEGHPFGYYPTIGVQNNISGYGELVPVTSTAPTPYVQMLKVSTAGISMNVPVTISSLSVVGTITSTNMPNFPINLSTVAAKLDAIVASGTFVYLHSTNTFTGMNDFKNHTIFTSSITANAVSEFNSKIVQSSHVVLYGDARMVIGAGDIDSYPGGDLGLHMENKNILLKTTTTIPSRIRWENGYLTQRPIFHFGGISSSSIAGEYMIAFTYQSFDQSQPERPVLIFDSSGTIASVRMSRGSQMEGFVVHGDTEPIYRLNSWPYMRLELGEGGWERTDTFLSRPSSKTLSIAFGDSLGAGTTVAIFNPSSSTFLNKVAISTDGFLPCNLTVGGGDNQFMIRNDYAGDDMKQWTQKAGADYFALLVANDAYDSFGTAIRIDRAGATVSSITIPSLSGPFAIGMSAPLTYPKFQISNYSDQFLMQENDATTDNKNWLWKADGNIMSWLTTNDAYDSFAPFMQVGRANVAISSVCFPSGNVGIGTTEPTVKLEVNGAIISSTITAHRILRDNSWHIYGGTQAALIPISLAQNVWTTIENATHTLWNSDEYDGFSLYEGTMTIANSGHYTGNLAITFSGGNGNDYDFRVWNITQSKQEGYDMGASGTGANNYVNVSIPLHANVTAGDELILQAVNKSASNEIVIRSAIFYMSYRRN